MLIFRVARGIKFEAENENELRSLDALFNASHLTGFHASPLSGSQCAEDEIEAGIRFKQVDIRTLGRANYEELIALGDQPPDSQTDVLKSSGVRE